VSTAARAACLVEHGINLIAVFHVELHISVDPYSITKKTKKKEN